ncbi:hypothetical protein ACFQXB_12800 [Plastorhodobacter daqingensis]|uniref:Uncharacterized protein n=1 Tax=Plastorhodobacter daqingensis TaxID=1387281 RepID=A0ABW2UK26_9RHOB
MRNDRPATTETGSERNTARLRMAFGRVSIESDVAISAGGLLAIGGMVSGILLSVTALVWVATRKLPDGSLPAGIRKDTSTG